MAGDEAGNQSVTVWFTNSDKGWLCAQPVRTIARSARLSVMRWIAGWSGKIVVLYPTHGLNLRGKLCPAMRVRIPPPKQAHKATASPPKQTPKPVEEELDDDFDDPDQLDDAIPDVAVKPEEEVASCRGSPPLFLVRGACLARTLQLRQTYHAPRRSGKTAAGFDAADRAAAMGGVAVDATAERPLAETAVSGAGSEASCQHQGFLHLE